METKIGKIGNSYGIILPAHMRKIAEINEKVHVHTDGRKIVITAPLNSTIKKWPTRVNVTIKNKSGQVALDQIRCIDKRRIKDYLETFTSKEVKEVNNTLLEIFK
ncbi:type II toxin-antitoxin system PemK/MazF family toxin [Aquimarina sp. ERC-38]|uniref:type II toxin-antitoxin system PemK/MazF family toxin n=1 Tax=Aquimarina sp. ERC-38 TaxID=2949996 RepID=UPI002245841A|nr:type II toxin-antitoxin system PemK/MazF family toxin [Aquimarina sp. ERC-38]UZO81723.1 type II toxin-antitoxin system PemK/MazF family toxin [Aquimarina sp. ERC-38]